MESSTARGHCSGNLAKTVSSDRDVSKVVDRIFMRMASIYGNTWSRNFPNSEALSVAKAEWIRVIDGVSSETLKLAFDSIDSGSNSSFVSRPPNLIEFKIICEASDTKHFDTYPSKMLDFRGSPSSVGNEAMEKIRGMLNMGKMKMEVL